MHTKTPRFGWNKIIIGLAVAGAICSVALWIDQADGDLPSANPTVRTGEFTGSLPASAAPVASKPTLPAPREVFSDERPAKPEPVPANIARVFPSIERRVVDWRKFRPESLTVAPHPDLPISFSQVAIKEDGKYVTWIGRNKELPGASFVGVATVDGYDAILILPGAPEFSFHVRGEAVAVSEMASGEDGCGNFPAQPPLSPKEFSAVVLHVAYATGHEPLPEAVHAVIDGPKVDVLVAYDAEARERAAQTSPSDPIGYLDAQAKARIETSNVVLNQSGVTSYQWRYLGLVAAPAYEGSVDSLKHFSAIVPGGAIFDWVKAERYKRGADQVVLMVGANMDFAGRAASSTTGIVSADRASAVVRWNSSAMTFLHELAHNFGCQHDREHVDVLSLGQYGPAAPDNDGKWHYGLMWANTKPFPTYPYDVGTSGTVMSYSDYDVPYFSNPNISITVTPSMLGWGWSTNPSLGTHVIGRPETDPKAANNAKVLQERGVAMSGQMEEIGLPAIVQHPQSSTVTPGSTAGVSVTASGGGLSYQWLKNGVKIDGATGTIYTKVAANEDTGDYTVTVSNLKGSVTSNSAKITVQALVVTPPPTSNNTGGGGGGGGGGAPSAWFYALSGAAALGRWLTRRVRSSRTLN
ncbi:M12 family metallo-peptidase [Oleiharenicola lentus]|uniref:M12 family metallo-peptidase n=1 Tax=Oleiharenicola lentus TaxID=2508720 RepID=UPI003F678E38